MAATIHQTLIRFFSRFTLIANLCLVLFVILSGMEQDTSSRGIPGTVEQLPFLKEVIIILGFPAIIINLLMCTTYSVLLVIGRGKLIPVWIATMNALFLVFQVVYFFVLPGTQM